MAEWICGEKTSPLGYQYIDVVHREELVRCKECKYGEPMCKPWDDIVCTQNRATHCPDWFCADGERKNNNAID